MEPAGNLPGNAGYAAGAENGYVDQNECEKYHGDGGNPGDDVKCACVDEVTHQIATVDEQKHENEDDWKPNAVAHLRKDEDFFQRGTRDQDDRGAHNDHSRIETVKDRCVIEFVVDARFKSHSFA